MRFGSLFSGVGGFDMGLEAAGMTPAWQVEIEPQAASVLRYRWPSVDLHADVRNVGASNLARVDLICGGFPCQDLSVAGKRRGLAGERSGLFYEFMRVVDELAPRWVLIENVPGLLSSNGGRDMGTVLGVLGRLGYGWTYRCLDTQYFGPPQRRLRVFIVGRAGGFCPPEVLLEPEGLPWNPAPSREAREGSARGLAGGVAGEGRLARSLTAERGQRNNGTEQNIIAATLQATGAGTARPGGQKAEGDSYVVAHTLRAEGADASEDGTGRGTPLVVGYEQDVFCEPHGYAPTLAHSSNSHMGHHQPKVLAFDTTQVTSVANYSRPQPGDPCHPLAAGAHAPAIAYALGSHAGAADGDQTNRSHAAGGPTGMGVQEELAHSLRGGRTQGVVHAIPRRLTPRECERLQGWPDVLEITVPRRSLHDFVSFLREADHSASWARADVLRRSVLPSLAEVAHALANGRQEASATNGTPDFLRAVRVYGRLAAGAGSGGGAMPEVPCGGPHRERNVGAGPDTGCDLCDLRVHLSPEAAAAIEAVLGPGVLARDGTALGPALARLGGWTRWGRKPDGTVVELSDSARYRMAGNGVSGPVAEWIGGRLMSERQR